MLKPRWTFEQYHEAKSYLVTTGQLHLLQKELSTDGYALIQLANALYERDEKERKHKSMLKLKMISNNSYVTASINDFDHCDLCGASIPLHRKAFYLEYTGEVDAVICFQCVEKAHKAFYELEKESQ